jgi:hypothetical protein
MALLKASGKHPTKSRPPPPRGDHTHPQEDHPTTPARAPRPHHQHPGTTPPRCASPTTGRGHHTPAGTTDVREPHHRAYTQDTHRGVEQLGSSLGS